MFAAHLIEGIVAEGKVAAVEVADDVGAGRRVHVDTDRPRELIRTATNVKNTRQDALRREILARNFAFDPSYLLGSHAAILRRHLVRNGPKFTG